MNPSLGILTLNSLFYLISSVISIFGLLLLLRAWLYRWAMSPNHPFMQLAHKSTDWIIKPLSRIVPPYRDFDTPTVLVALLTALLSMFVKQWMFDVVFSPVDLIVMPIAILLCWGLNMLVWGMLIWVILTWVNPTSMFTYTLNVLLEPFLRPVRRFLPSLGGFDFSPVVIFIVAQALLTVLMPIANGYVKLF